MPPGYSYQSDSSDEAGYSTSAIGSDDSQENTLTPKSQQRKPWCRSPFSMAGVCHACYVCQFLIFMVVFPLWAKWLVTSPMPTQYWHDTYPKWPAIGAVGGHELALNSVNPIQMSAIPQTPDSCNYSCSSWRGFRTAEMNFQVSLTLNDSMLSKAYAHTVYPVLLASADFKDWWVVADRRHAWPSPFWRARTAKAGHSYSYLTDTCTKPPTSNAEGSDRFTSTYVLACVTWSPTAFAKLESAKGDEIMESELATLCNTVGGVCGWSCDSTIPSDRLPGCTADGTIEVTKTSVAGTQIPHANFVGNVKMRECLHGSSSSECETATGLFKSWKCHKCLYDSSTDDEDRRLQGIPGMGAPPIAIDDDDDDALPGAGVAGAGKSASSQVYLSLPRFKVIAEGTSVPSGTDVFSQPRTFILTSSVAHRGMWKKLYKVNDGKTKPPVALDSKGEPVDKTWSAQEPGSIPMIDAASAHAMNLQAQNRLDIEPSWCYGMQGPMYLVACAVNSTLYDSGFTRFKAGQQAAPPPFNDRCMAVAGRCGHACQAEQPSMTNCSSNGHIEQKLLVGSVQEEKNQTTPVWLFVYVLLIGFGVKVVMLCPGIFSPYPHCRRYDPVLTESLRYIVVCVPSAGENKCTVLRNVIGAVGCMPKDCKCRYHVAFVDEGHRAEQKAAFGKLGKLIDAIPKSSKTGSYSFHVSQFFHQWVDDTKKLELKLVKDGVKGDIETPILERMSGRATLRKLKREQGWEHDFPAHVLQPLEAAIDILEQDLKNTKREQRDLHRDDVYDWEPQDRNSLALRLHYLARAKPPEDERTIKAQHVAPGTWYYQVPVKAQQSEWLQLRAQGKEMVYGLEDDDITKRNVPLRTSRGKAGGLNFTENYLSLYADEPKNLYGDQRDDSPYLFSICDARHQFQTDFFHTTIPYFFDEDQNLDPRVGFTQCPQFFHEMADKLDYLDNNNAQFFRLNCMIRNCCGGVSSCGTNGTWAIYHRPGESIWEMEKTRVRDAETKVKSKEYVERRTFHESCKVEDTASSLQQVLKGNHSQFINRRLSYGMAKNPIDYLAAVQRWAEGGVVLSLQTFLSCHKGVYMLWFTFLFFVCFLASLFHMVSKTRTSALLVDLGLVDKTWFDSLIDQLTDKLRSFAFLVQSETFQRNPQLLNDYVTMTIHFILWVTGICCTLLAVFLATELLKVIQRGIGCKLPCVWPDEMRWWGRLLISMDNLTYFLWFWTAFFWIGFNYYSVFAERSYHFGATGMFSFMLIVQILSWGMVISSSLRYTLGTSMEANEVISLSMDNIWRSTQLFYMSAPLLGYSIIKGVQDFMRYKMYGEDISYWVGGDRGAMSTNLVKYWTLLLIIGAVVAWIYYFTSSSVQVGALGSCLIVTLIALDVLHPCVYLWVGSPPSMSDEKAASKSWAQCLTDRSWYARQLHNLILNSTMTGLLKWLGPAWFVAMPFLTLVMPYIGVNQAFMMIGSTTNR
eukprot:TRINITY_DN2555_c0_g1_i3.p1 TRINITY_DN2555_c0_g1~~TRINITY_DN2555_c0_g1_i3.p1  ORF type:complete len:1469 (-),score=249.07 TRINITY_DN2555_c0_g1_i3:284-4690(-)